jgi:hypothetical protein
LDECSFKEISLGLAGEGSGSDVVMDLQTGLIRHCRCLNKDFKNRFATPEELGPRSRLHSDEFFDMDNFEDGGVDEDDDTEATDEVTDAQVGGGLSENEVSERNGGALRENGGEVSDGVDRV